MLTRWISLAPAVLLLSGCGYVGDPLPPALHIPGKVTDLRVIQHEDRIQIRFTVPELTTEGLPLKLGKADLRAGPSTPQPFDPEAWATRAEVLDTASVRPGAAEVEHSSLAWTDQEVYFRVRILSDKRKDGGWSEFAILRVIPPLVKPSELRAEAVVEGVRISWTGPKDAEGMAFRIRRRQGKGALEDLATARSLEWVDAGTRYGETYEYSVQSFVEANGARAESAYSDPVSVEPVDRFPPAVPTGLTALTGTSTIELAWDPNTDGDFASYYLYRAAGEGAFERIGGSLTSPSYSDKEARPGVRYRYALSAVDPAGNESQRSGTVDITLR